MICFVGKIPMRHLVYRVQALPQGLLPLVWDFGQLDVKTEKMYIAEMVKKIVRRNRILSDSQIC